MDSQPALATAGINKTLNFQGRLLTNAGAVVADGNYNIRFKIYQDGAGTAANNGGTGLMWTEIWQNSNTQGIVVKNGYFSVPLGTICAFSGGSCQGNTNTAVDWNQDTLWLSMDVTTNGTDTGASPTYNGEMLPMRRMASAVYALQAENSNKLGGLTSGQFVQLAQPIQSAVTTSNAAIGINVTSGSGNMITLQSGGTDVFDVSSTGNLVFGNDSNKTISVTTSAASTVGRDLTVSAGGGGSGTGSNGGALTVSGGAAGGTNANGGNIVLTPGVKTGSGTPGSVVVKPASSNDTASLFVVQNAAGTALFNLDSTANATNLVTNGSFEQGVSGWSNFGGAGSLDVLTNHSLSGLYGRDGLYIPVTGTGQGAKFPVTLTAGQAYTLSFYSYASASGGATTFGFGYSANGSTNTDCSNSPTSFQTTGWTRYSCTFTPGTISGSPYLFIFEEAGGATRNIYVDGVELEHTISTNFNPYQESRAQVNGIVNSPLVLQNASDSTGAFQVYDTGATPVLNVDTLNDRVGIGTGNPLAVLSVSANSGTNNTIPLVKFNQLGTATGGVDIVDIQANAALNSQAGSGLSAGAALNVVAQGGGATSGITSQVGGTGGTIALQTGAGGAATGGSGTETGGAGGAFTLQSGVGGNATSGIGGAGGAITITSGNGGNGTGANANGNGGNITLSAGKSGTGGTGGSNGGVLVKPVSGGDYASAFLVQNAAGTASIFDVDTANQRIGINTSSPSTALQFNQGTVALPGTASAPGGGTTLTGSGTSFLSTLLVGDVLTITAGSQSCTIASITSNTVLDCSSNLSSTSGATSYSLTSSNPTRLVVLQNGKLGIGTSSPTRSLQVTDAAGNTAFSVDTENLRVGVGTSNPTNRFNVSGGNSLFTNTSTTSSTPTVSITTTTTPTSGGTQTGFSTTLTNTPTSSANTAIGQSLTLTDNTTLANTLQGAKIVVSDTGASGAKTVQGLVVDTSGTTNTSATVNTAIFKSAASTTAFQVQNASGTSLLTADTTNQQLTTLDLNVGAGANVTAGGRLFSDGFDQGNFKLWTIGTQTSPTSTVAVDSTTAHAGKYSALFTETGSGSAYVDSVISTAATSFSLRGYVKIGSNPSTALSLLRTYNSSTTGIAGLYLDSSAHLGILHNAGTLVAGSQVMSTGTWHKVELQYTIAAGTAVMTAYLDGVSSATTSAGTTSTPDRIRAGDPTTHTGTFNLDDVVLDTGTTGAGDAASLYLADSLHVSGTASFASSVLVQPLGDSTQALLVQNAAGTASVLDVDTSGLKVGILTATPTQGTLSFGYSAAGRSIAEETNSAGAGGDLTVKAGAAGSGSTAGGNLILNGGAGNSAGAGGNATLQGGTGGATGVGGIATVQGGTGGGTSGTGGDAKLLGGTSVGAFAGGTATVQGGAANATAGSNGGAVAVTGAPGSTTGTGGDGGSITITAGNAGGSGVRNGGTITLAGGSVGAGGSTGVAGGVLVKNVTDIATAFQVQNAAGAAVVQVGATAANSVTVTSQTAPTGDIVAITNSGQASATTGVDALAVTFGSSNASGDALHVISSYAGGATDNLTYNGFELGAFSPTNGAGTDKVNGIKLGNLTDPGATILSSAMDIGTGWDNLLTYNDQATVLIDGTGHLNLAQVTGTLGVANGGTGAATYASNNVLLGNGTGAFQVVAPGSNGNILTSNGTTWTSAAPAAGCATCIAQVPATTAQNTITPTVASVVALTVNNTTNGTSEKSLIVNQSSANDAVNINVTGSSQTNGLLITRTNAGTLTNAININNSSGTVTNGLSFSGTITADITTGTSNRDLTVSPNGSGKVIIGGTAPTISFLSTAAGNINFSAAAAGAANALGITGETAGSTNQGGAVNVTGGTAAGAAAGGLVTIQGGAASATAASTGGGVTVAAANGSGTGAGGNGGNVLINAGNGAGTGPTNGGTVTLQGGSAVGAGTVGGVIVKNVANSTSAFQVQSALGTSLITVDTTNSNLLTNPSVEQAISGNWALKGTSTVTQDATQAYLGSDSLKIVATATDGGGQQAYTFSNVAYTLSFYAKLDSGSASFSTFVAGWNVAGDNNCSLSSNNPSGAGTVSTSQWYRYWCTFTPSAGAGTIYFKQTNGTTHTYYVDAVQMIATSSVTPYREGGLSFNGLVTSPLSLYNEVAVSNNSTDGFTVYDQSASPNRVLTVDTTNNRVAVGGSTSSGSKFYVTSSSNVPIRTYNSNSGNTGNLIEMQTYNGGSAIDAFDVSNNGSILFGNNSDKTISVSQASSGAGKAITVTAGQAAAGTSDGGALGLVGGIGGNGATGNGGAVNITGGAAASTNGSGGGITLGGGAATGTGTPGGVLVKNAGESTTAFQVQTAAGTQILGVDTVINGVTDVTNNTVSNLITNPSFETGTTGWVKMGSTQVAVAQDTTLKHSGADSLKVVMTSADGAGTDGAKFNLTTTTLAANTKYTFSVYARTKLDSTFTTTNFTTFELGRSEDGTANSSCLTAQTVSVSGWTQYSCTFTTGSTTTNTPYVYIKETDAATRTVWIDSASLTRWSLLANATVEQAISGNWSTKGTTPTLTKDATQFTDGANSLKIVTQATANQGTKNNITLNDSTLYTLSFQAKLDIDTGTQAATFATMEAGYSSDGSTDNTICMTAQTVVRTAWTTYTCTFITPSSHSGTPYFYIKQTNAAIHWFYVDAVQLTFNNGMWSQEGKISLNGVISSPVTLQNQADSTEALQVRNAAGTVSVFKVDTTNSRVAVTKNDSVVNGLPLLVEQQGAGDTGIELKTPTKNFYTGVDATTGEYKIASAATANGTWTEGDTTDWHTTGQDSNANGTQALQFTATHTGSVSSATVYIYSLDAVGSRTIQVGVYTNATGASCTTTPCPYNLLGSSAQQEAVVGWNTISLSGISLVSGTTYWLAMSENGSNKFAYGGSGVVAYDTSVGTIGFPMNNKFDQAAGNTAFSISIYLTGVTSGTADYFGGTSLMRMSDTGQTVFQNLTNTTAAFQVQNAAGTKLLAVDSLNGKVGIGAAPSIYDDNVLQVAGGVSVGARTDSGGTTSDWIPAGPGASGAPCDSAATSVDTIKSSVVYNGSLYIGTSEGDKAEVCRRTDFVWERINSASGTFTGSFGSHTNTDTVTAMTVYNGYLYIATTGGGAGADTNKASLYRWDGTSTTFTLINTTQGTFKTTTNIDSVTSMVVYKGQLFLGTTEADSAEMYRYNGSTGASVFTNANSTAGTLKTDTLIDGISAMVVVDNQLYVGINETNKASVYLWNGATGSAAPFTKLTTTGNFDGEAAGAAVEDEVDAMVVYNGSLIAAVGDSTAARVFRMTTDDITGGTNFRMIHATAGTFGAETNVDFVKSMAVYGGNLYIGTQEANKGSVYQYDGETTFNITNSTAGTLNTTTSIDGVTTMAVFNDRLYVGTTESNLAETYYYTKVEGQSSRLSFYASSDNATSTQQADFLNYGSIYFAAEQNATSNLQASTGTFIFDHGISTTAAAYDVAEDYPTRDSTLQAGDLVSIDPNETGFVRKASGPYDSGLVGVYSMKPALRLTQTDATINGGRAVPVALAGRVPIRVSTANGDILPGDPLTSSDVPGVAMKATGSGRIVGMAMESYSGPEVGMVMSFVNPNYFSGITSVQGSAGLASMVVDGKLTAKDLEVSGKIATKDLDVSGSATLSSLTVAGAATVKSLKVEGAAEVESLLAKSVSTSTLEVTDNAVLAKVTVAGNVALGGSITKAFVAGKALKAGQVVVADAAHAGRVTTTIVAGDTRVLGVVTEDAAAGAPVNVAIGGTVRVKVAGGVGVGDLLASDVVEGTASKLDPPKLGAMIGKVLSAPDADGKVEMLVTLE